MHRPISNFPTFSDLQVMNVIDASANDSEETYAEILELLDQNSRVNRTRMIT